MAVVERAAGKKLQVPVKRHIPNKAVYGVDERSQNPQAVHLCLSKRAWLTVCPFVCLLQSRENDNRNCTTVFHRIDKVKASSRAGVINGTLAEPDHVRGREDQAHEPGPAAVLAVRAADAGMAGQEHADGDTPVEQDTGVGSHSVCGKNVGQSSSISVETAQQNAFENIEKSSTASGMKPVARHDEGDENHEQRGFRQDVDGPDGACCELSGENNIVVLFQQDDCEQAPAAGHDYGENGRHVEYAMMERMRSFRGITSAEGILDEVAHVDMGRGEELDVEAPGPYSK